MVTGVTVSEDFFIPSLITLIWLVFMVGSAFGKFSLRDITHKVPSKKGPPFNDPSDNARDYRKRKRSRDFIALNESFGGAVIWYAMSLPATLMLMFDYGNPELLLSLLQRKWGIFAWVVMNMLGDWFFRKGLIAE